MEPSQPASLAVELRQFLIRRNALLLALFLLAYLAAACRIAQAKPLWYDEIFTATLARFETPRELWDHLAAGADLNPPLIYLLTKLSVVLCGETSLSLRLPSILAFGLFLWGMHRLVAGWLGVLQAWLAVLLLTASSVAEYAVEARPYALVLLCAVLALWCWRNAVPERQAAWLWRVGLGLSLVAALSSHFYTVLLFPALAGVEISRTVHTRRWQLWNWAALVLPGLTLATYAPLLARAKTYAVGFWARADWLQSEPGYAFYLSHLAFPLVVSLIVLAVTPRQTPAPAADQDGQPLDYWNAVGAGVAYTLIPFLGVALGVLITGVFSFRYALPGAIGLCLLFALLVQRQTEGRPLPLLVLVLAFGVWTGVTWKARYEIQSEKAATLGELRQFLEKHGGGRGVVIAPAHSFLATVYYADGHTFRPVYLADPDLANRHEADTTEELGLRALGQVTPLPVVGLEDYLREKRTLLFFGNTWLNRELRGRGYVFEEVADFGKDKLYRVRKE